MRGYEKSFIRRRLLLFTYVSLSLEYMFRKAGIALTLLPTYTHAQGGILCDLTDLPVPTYVRY